LGLCHAACCRLCCTRTCLLACWQLWCSFTLANMCDRSIHPHSSLPQALRNTVPVPRHWSQKRKYLQGKRGCAFLLSCMHVACVMCELTFDALCDRFTPSLLVPRRCATLFQCRATGVRSASTSRASAALRSRHSNCLTSLRQQVRPWQGGQRIVRGGEYTILRR
jgi:hypothetical protein